MTKKVHIKTWGCQMNVYDSARMVDVVAPLGYQPTDNPSEADLIILNTCHIREKATEKLFSELGRLKTVQEQKAAIGERVMLAVAGCVAQAEGPEIKRRAPYVDMVFGPQTYHQLPEMIARVSRGRGIILNTEFPVESKFDHLPQNDVHVRVSSFLSIQEGCDKFCTFCVVPYTRGAEYSRSSRAILDEARRMVDAGARELTLLGQNVNAFHGFGVISGKDTTDIWGLGRLCQELAKIDGLRRMRYMTSHPRDVDDALLEAHRELPQIMPFLHLPVQSGSDRILEAMNRKHTADDYRRIIERFRAARSDIVFSSDFIVGFPGETDADFADTIQLVKDIGFAQSFSFKYSRRPGTPAATMPNQVDETIKDERLNELQTLLLSQQKTFNQRALGQTMPVLLEEKSRRDGYLFGRTPYMQTIMVAADESHIGYEMPVRITECGPNSLTGSLEYASQTSVSPSESIHHLV